MVLQIRVQNTGIAADETARLKMVGRPQAGAKQQPLDTDLQLGKGSHGRIEGDRLFAAVLHIGFQVVMQVLPDAAQGRDYADIERCQRVWIAHA